MRLPLRLLAGVLMLAAVGATYQSLGAASDRAAFQPPGQLVDVGGFDIHLHCTGSAPEGAPTFILESLSGGSSSYWGWVREELARDARVCAYDRAGRAWSEPDTEPVTLRRTVRNLDRAIEAAAEPGPFVLVGHSIGGLYVRGYALEHAEAVAAVVLVDSAHPEQFERFPSLKARGELHNRLSAVFPVAARLGVMRAYFALGGDMDFGKLREPERSELKWLWSSPAFLASQRAEAMAAPQMFADARGLGDLGDIPLTVVTAGDSTEEWRNLQADLSELSSRSRHETIDGATHVSLIFDPAHARALSAIIREAGR